MHRLSEGASIQMMSLLVKPGTVAHLENSVASSMQNLRLGSYSLSGGLNFLQILRRAALLKAQT